MSDQIVNRCSLCGEPMPEGEEMFKFHGYSGPCPKPPKPTPKIDAVNDLLPHLKQALRQWSMYAEMVEGTEDFDLAKEKSPEGELYRAALAAVEKVSQSPQEGKP